ncbi:hypothetical protein SNEBB_001641 [Seison nebaliae]|nr:hypothetical protein SNEBB_001641 [Seison nebaliae]
MDERKLTKAEKREIRRIKEQSTNELHIEDTAVEIDCPVPDGGWGWVIVIASFLIHVIADGVVYSFGVLVPPLIKYFDSSRAIMSWIGALIPAVTFISGPIASMITNKFGCRITTMSGAVIAAIGFCASSFVTEVNWLFLTMGVIGGFGMGLVYLPAIVSVGFYFENRRAFATGLAVCGSGIGTFLFAPFTEYLLREYLWRGTVLLISGIIFECVLFGTIMKPLPSEPAEVIRRKIDMRREYYKKRVIEKTDFMNQMAGDVVEDDKESYSVRKQLIENSEKKIKPKSSFVRYWSIETRDVMKELLDPSLFHDMKFVLIVISNILTMIGYNVPYLLIVDQAKERGIPTTQAAWLISAIGIANTVARIFFGLLADHPKISVLFLYSSSLTLCGIVTIIQDYICINFGVFLFYSVWFGFFIGSYVLLTPILLVDQFGIDKLTNSFGLTLMFQGFATLGGPAFCGWLRDKTESYTLTYVTCGVFIAASGLILIFIPIIDRLRKAKEKEQDNLSINNNNNNNNNNNYMNLDSREDVECPLNDEPIYPRKCSPNSKRISWVNYQND